jgi:nucleotide-binding universal stress UspA family protein
VNTSTGGSAAYVVLVGVDGSESSWNALSWACGEANRLSGRLVTVFVDFSFNDAAAGASVFGGAMAYDVITQVRADIDTALTDQVCGFANTHGLDLKFVHARGDAANKLRTIAASEHADLVVIGRSMKSRRHLGRSVGRRLVEKDDVPVIVVVP